MRRGTLAIPAGIADEILGEATRYAPKETGGVLLGLSERNARVVWVSELIGAGPGARRERHCFEPDGPWQRARIAERYEASGRMLAYLGDWHSHPSGNGPSRLDRSTARRIATSPAARCPHPAFLIVTRLGECWELRGYRFKLRQFTRMDVHSSGGKLKLAD
jgi:integrative and conjugative element protein (TIGR02256 family)